MGIQKSDTLLSSAKENEFTGPVPVQDGAQIPCGQLLAERLWENYFSTPKYPWSSIT